MFKNKYIVQGDQNMQVPAHVSFGKFMLDRLRRMGDEVAIQNPQTKEKLSYKELTEYAVKLSKVLTNLGVRKGDVVALGSEIRLMFIPTALAIILSGATYTSYQFDIGQVILKHKMEVSKPKHFICSELFWKTNREFLLNFETVKTFMSLDDSKSIISLKSLISSMDDVDVNLFEPVPVQGQFDEVAIFYSSGTTGLPKGVRKSHLNALVFNLPIESMFDEDSIKTVYVIPEWYFDYESFVTFKMLALGKSVVYSSFISPEIVIETFETVQVNLAFLVSPLVSLLSKTEKKHNIGSLKYVYCAGSPLHVITVENFKERFKSVRHVLLGYGMTETWFITSQSTKEIKMGSVGSVCPCITLKVENPETQEVLGPKQTGQICVKIGPAFMKGYIDVDPSTYLDEEGWFRTGDLGYYDVDGHFYIVDRIKEMIDHDAYKISPMELEVILMLHPGVREVGVVGKPVPIFGEEPTAFVVRLPNSDVTEQELVDFVAAKVPRYMQLKGGVKFIAHLPRNQRGKILRRKLREMLNVQNANQ